MILQANSSHWDAISAIYQEGIRTNDATFESAGNLKDYAHWISSKIADACFVFLFEDEVVGWSALSPVSSRCVYSGVAEVSVYVRQNRTSQGIGSALLTALIEYAEHHAIWTVEAGIFPENTASIALHQKLGFRQVGYREKIGKMNGRWRDTYLFERRSTSIQ